MIPKEKINEIRERADIVEIVGEHVQLIKAGANFKGVCPFHADSDPSFNVNIQRQFYNCFGCGAHGDVILFIQKLEGLSFREAAERLAARYGVELPKREMSPAARSAEERAREFAKRRLYVIDAATAFYEQQLWDAPGGAARAALQERGVSEESARVFRMGFAPDSWDSLIRALGAARISPKEMFDTGLVQARKSGDGYYDRFRNRLMFTITNSSGHPIAFSGRRLGGDDEGAKYINSPETTEYKKSKVLFGLHPARVAISKLDEAILVEGNFDVVSLYDAGVQNVVAPLGTALTEEQVLQLRRRASKVTLMFDGDNAGQKAAAKAFPFLAKMGIASYMASLPEGEDPDSIVRSKGPAGIEKLLAGRQGLFDAIIDRALSASDGTAQDVSRRIEQLGQMLKNVSSTMERDLYLQKIAQRFNIDTKTVFKYFRGATDVSVGQTSPAKKPSGPPGRVEERELIGLMIDQPHYCEQAQQDGLLGLMTTEPLRRLAEELVNRHRAKESLVGDLIPAVEDANLSTWFASRAMLCHYEEDDAERAAKAFEEISRKLKTFHTRLQIAQIEEKISAANAAGDDMRVLELLREKTEVQKELHDWPAVAK